MNASHPLPASLWWDTLPTDLREPLDDALEGETTADVVIVGAGYTGLWTAFYLLRAAPMLRVRILEAEVAGFGASGRNGGWASALFPASMDAVARHSSRAAAVDMQCAMHATVDEMGAVAREGGWDIHWAKGGTVVAARTPAQWRRAQDHIAHWRSWGFGPEDYRLLDANEARDILGATDVLGATYTPHCAAIHPARLVRHLALAVRASGATVHENSRVVSLEPGIVRTEHGSVRAPLVVRATEGYTADLPGFRRVLAPVYSLMLATEPLEDDIWSRIGLDRRETFSDERHLIIYGQRTADGRLAFGGRGAPYHYGSAVKAEYDRDPRVFAELWRALTDLFPELADRAVTHTWGGPLGVPRDWHASCGFDATTGLAWAGGYVGDGVGASHLAGRTLADLLLGNDSPRTRLPWVGHRSPRWEPEPLRWLGTNVGLRAMDSADAAEARTGRPSRRARMAQRFLGG